MAEDSSHLPARPVRYPRRALLPWIIAAGLAVVCGGLTQLYLSQKAEIAVLTDQQALANLESIGASHQLEAERILANRQLADDKRHLDQLNQQIDQATHQLADSRRGFVELSARHIASSVELKELREKLAVAGGGQEAGKLPPISVNSLAQIEIATLTPRSSEASPASALVLWNPSTQDGLLRVKKLPAPPLDHDYQLWVTDPAVPQPVDGGVVTADLSADESRLAFKVRQPVTKAVRFAITLERKGGATKPEGPLLLGSD